MSYILDALKKSEHERKQGKVPGLNSFQLEPKPTKSTNRILIYMLIATFLFLSLTIGPWLYFRQSTTMVPLEVSNTVSNQEEQSELEKPEQPAATATQAIDTTEAEEQSQPAATLPEMKPPAPAPAKPAPEPEKIKTAKEEIPVVVQDLASGNEPGKPKIPVDVEFPEDTPDNYQDSNTPKKARITSFNKLPRDVRDALPEIVIAAHYYSSKPSARMASINGRIMRQGQTISNGLVVDEIVRDGVIFSFHDYRFNLRVFAR